MVHYILPDCGDGARANINVDGVLHADGDGVHADGDGVHGDSAC